MISLPATPNLHPALTTLHTLKRMAVRMLPHVKQAALVTGGGIAVFAVLNGMLFVACRGRVAPFTKINGVSYGFSTYADASKKLASQHASALLALNVQDKAIQLNAVSAGVQIMPDETLKQLSHSSGLWQLPIVNAFSSLSSELKPVYKVDEAALAKTLEPYIAVDRLEPKDAVAIIPSSAAQKVEITAESTGHELNATVAAEQVASQIADNNFTLKITPAILPAKWSAQDLAAFMPQIEAARQLTLTIKAGDKELVISGDTLQKLLRVDESGANLVMTLDKPGLIAHLKDSAGVFYAAPIATKVSLLDGVEVSRSDGAAGRALDADKTADVIIATFVNGVLLDEPSFVTLDPAIIYTRTYSNTDAGLFKMIEEFAKTHGGKYKVAAIELEGAGHRSAFYNADDTTVTASTYKLFIAYAILQRLAERTLSTETPTSHGTVGDCMRLMIVVSDNACADALHDVTGWAALDTKIASDGFAATRINNQIRGDKISTARDEANLLSKLYFHELLDTDSTNYLFGLMKQQIYRSGIPAGSRGSTVADKVGFFDSYNHDAGIVYSPKSTYALVILTEGGGGFGNVKALSQQIYDFYNQ